MPSGSIPPILTGSVCGFFNGSFITRIKVTPLIMTLATLALFRGRAEGISQARSVRGYPEWFFVLGQGEFRCEMGKTTIQNFRVALRRTGHPDTQKPTRL